MALWGLLWLVVDVVSFFALRAKNDTTDNSNHTEIPREPLENIPELIECRYIIRIKFS